MFVQAEDAIQESIEESTVGIYDVEHNATSWPEDKWTVLEGQRVLHDLDNVASAAAMSFSLMYTLNLKYPPELKYFFEVLQKTVMELDGNTLSKKVQALKIRLESVVSMVSRYWSAFLLHRLLCNSCTLFFCIFCMFYTKML